MLTIFGDLLLCEEHSKLMGQKVIEHFYNRTKHFSDVRKGESYSLQKPVHIWLFLRKIILLLLDPTIHFAIQVC